MQRVFGRIISFNSRFPSFVSKVSVVERFTRLKTQHSSCIQNRMNTLTMVNSLCQRRWLCTTQESKEKTDSEHVSESSQKMETSKPKRVKVTTGLVGIEVQPHGREILIKLYEKMLEELKKFEPEVEFRKWMEALLKRRLKILYETEDVFEIEDKIGIGQIEELIIEAETQLNELLPLMLQERPWEAPKWHTVFILWDPVQ